MAAWALSIFYGLCLTIDGLIYNLVSYSYNLFMLVCQLNFNSLYALISPLIDRIQAVIMVFIMFKTGIVLIQLMINPDDAPKTGVKLIKNIFIVGAMLVCYNLVFNILNEFSMLIIGVPEGYSFTTLARIANITDTNDEGLINRFVFGKGKNVSDIGDFIALSTFGIFVRDADDESQSTKLEQAVADGDHYDFTKASNLSKEVDKSIKYTWLVSGLIGIYITYCIISVALEVAVRMFKLLVLQLIAPIAIISKLDEKNDIFKKYVSLYTSTYLSAFLRIATMLVMNVLISQFIINIGEFFGGEISNAGNILTKGFLSLIIVFAGYTFIKALPDFLKQVFGDKFGGSSKGASFGNFMGSVLGAGIGGVAGLAAGISSGAGVAGTIANMGAGAFNGGVNGFKGNSISDKVKNLSGSVKKDIARADDWGRRGFSNVVGGAVHGAIGTKGRQDMQMYKYDQANSALKAYDAAQIEAIKDYKVGDSDTGFSWGEETITDASGNERTVNVEDYYSKGYESLKLGEDKDAFANQMIEYDTSYINSMAHLEAANASGNEAEIEKAKKELAEVKTASLDRAKNLYDRNKNAAKNDNIDAKRAAAEGAAKKAGIEVKTKDGNIDVKGTTKEITNKKHELENKTSYGQTHGAGKDK